MEVKKAFILLVMLAQPAFAEDLKSGKWTGQSEVSALTDKATMTWTVRGTNEVSNSIGRGEAPWFVVRCQDNTTDVFFVMNNYLGSDQQDMPYRIDGGAVKSIPASPSDDGRAIGLWAGVGTEFLTQLTGAKKLVMATKPYQSVQVEGVFEIDGIDEVIAGIKKTCNC